MEQQDLIYEVIILGGGISGLTTSFYLKDTPHLLLEKNTRFGGSILSLHEGNGVLECGPNFLLLRKTEAKNIIKELGLEQELLSPPPSARRRFVLLPEGLIALTPFSLLRHFFKKSPLTNWKFILGGASWKRAVRNESVYDFFSRKFSNYFATSFARPMVSGIYGGDAKRILMELAFPLFATFDQKFNSFWPGAFFHFLKKEKHNLPSGLYSFKEGLGYLSDYLVQKSAGKLELGQEVLSLAYSDSSKIWTVKTSLGSYYAHQIVSTLPAYEMAKLIDPIDKSLAEKFRLIDYPWLNVLFVAYKKRQIKDIPQGFGFLNAEIEKKSFLGCFYTSSMYPSRFNQDETVFTLFVGGSLRQDLKSISHEQLVFEIHLELKKLFDIEGDPFWSHQNSWDKAIPQYEIPVLTLREQLAKKNLFNGTLHFATNYVAGVSVPDCMTQAKKIAQNITSGGLHGTQV